MRTLWIVLLLLAPLLAEETPAPAAPAKSAADQRAEFKKKLVYQGGEFEAKVQDGVKGGDGITEWKLTYPSPVKTEFARNNTVHAALFAKDDAGSAAVIVLGGWMYDPATPQMARVLAQSGLKVLYVQIPFQEARTPVGEASGRRTLSADMDQNIASFVQIAQDVGRGMEWLVKERDVDAKRVGIMGTSLGGFAAASLFGVDDRFAGAVILLAGAEIGDVLLSKNWLLKSLATKLESMGYDRDKANKRMRWVSPRTWARKERKDAIYLVAAGADEIVPLETAQELAKLYGGARIDVIPGAKHVAAAMNLQSYIPKIQLHFEKVLAEQ
ncbi:MAG: prolyl oligopeptidase family serine peptidase [Planctomycetota bacterium]